MKIRAQRSAGRNETKRVENSSSLGVLYNLFRFSSSNAGQFDIREMAELQDKVLRCLDATVFDPCMPNRSIVDLGLVKSVRVDPAKGKIALSLVYPTAGHPHLGKVKHDITQALHAATSPSAQTFLPFALPPSLRSVDIAVPPPTLSSSPSSSAPLGSGLSHVQNIVAVSSCKGGVGKSTVAVNLALALAKQGNRVGLLDVDIYGPSLPTLLHVKGGRGGRPSLPPQPQIHPTLTLPSSLLRHLLPPFPPLKHLSFGHVKPSPALPGAGGVEAAVLRGPLASKVVTQLLLSTEWGELDYLLLDLPPGTGDVQITVTQAVGGGGGREGGLNGAVVVTTPQELAMVDVVKGVRMLEEMQVPTLACVVNMAYFVCDACDAQHHVFGGKEGKERLKARVRGAMRGEGGREGAGEVLTEEGFFELPLSPAVSRGNDTGRPVMMEDGGEGGREGGKKGGREAIQQVYFALATRVAEEIFRAKFIAQGRP
ncbi:mrp-like protein [Nannochloropsis gaditana]|uniref:Mrp-like protein n=1 Tax=Nannochloropsis gaditana TaxID=72520 RepID=W7TC32_9STRA|nr:mrp-like protein [Nannochloropsis gaditana]